MNKCRITKDFLKDIRAGLRKGKMNRKTRMWLKKWPVTLDGRNVMYKGKPLTAKEDIAKILTKELLTGGCPLGIESAFNYLYTKRWGISRRDIGAFLKNTERYQLMKTRPPDPNRIRGDYMHNREGTTRFLMSKKHGGPNHLAADLMTIPETWSKYKYFLCVVHIKSGYVWFEPQTSKTPEQTLSKFKPIVKEVEKRYGPVGMLSTDHGGEFLGKFLAFLNRKKITHQIDHKSFWAEKKIQTFGRIFGNMMTVHDFRKALALSLEKIRNIKTRTTGVAPAQWTEKDGLQKSKRLKKGARKKRATVVFNVGDRVRHLLKAAEQINIMYKSYRSLDGTSKYANWSKQVYTIEKRRSAGGVYSYYLNKKWYKGWQLQRVDGAVKLSLSKKELEQATERLMKTIGHMPKQPKFRKVKSLEIDMRGWEQPMRPRRARRAQTRVNYKGM